MFFRLVSMFMTVIISCIITAVVSVVMVVIGVRMSMIVLEIFM